MEISVIDKGRRFFSQVHLVIVGRPEMLIAASIGGLETSVNAITAALIEGRPCYIESDNNLSLRLDAFPGEYKRVIRKVDYTAHGLILHKSAVFNEEDPRHVILAEDGNIRHAVGKYLSKKFALPGEWVNLYYDMLPDVEELEVHINPLIDKYRGLKAVRLPEEVDEEYMLVQIDTRLKNGRLKIPSKLGSPVGKFDPKWDMKEYLKNNITALAGQLDVMQPHFNPKNPNHKMDKNIGLMKRIPFPVQAELIQGTVNALTNKNEPLNAVFCGGDMGTGKSITALGVINVLYQKEKEKGKKGYKVLIAAPGITIPKWQHKEIKETLPWAKVRVLKNHKDAVKLYEEAKAGYEPDGLEIVLVGTDRAKLGPDPWCTAVWKRVQGEKYYAWHCPDCGKALIDPDGDPEEGDCLAGWDVLATGDRPEIRGRKDSNGIPVDHVFPGWRKRSKLKKCTSCNAVLWRPAVKKRGETKNKPRWYISRILAKMGPWFDIFVQDEVHQTKAQDSGRGDAFAQLVKAAKKILMLTGTLVNGKSTSIKEILWRTDPGELLKNGFNRNTGMVQWAGRYGVLKKVTTVSETDNGITVRKKKTKLQPTEEPGIAPQMTTEYLLHKTAFMELADLGLPLVEKNEIPVFIDMDKDHALEYKAFHKALHEHCRKSAMRGGKGAWSKFLPAVLNYADRPDMGGYVEFNNGDIITAPEFDEGYYNAKERWLVKTVQKELSESRGVVIYNKYTASYGLNERIQKVLMDHNIDAKILKSNTSPEERVNWLSEREKEGCRVIICNMRLVEVGLDLLPWPTLIFYQLDYDINIVRQAGARSWRIGQQRECRVYYPILNETQQVAQFKNIMSKRAHALMVEGRLDRSELAKFGKDEHNSMAADLANCLSNSGLTDRWRELAEKDRDERLKIVSEEEFKTELDKAMKNLQKETLKLCGLTEVERKKMLEKLSKKAVEQTTRKESGQLSIFEVASTEKTGNGEVNFAIPLKVVKKPKGRGKKKVAVGQIMLDF